MRRIVFYSGGFAPLGGIETFARNLLCYLQGMGHSCELVCWGGRSPMLDEMQSAGVSIHRSPWRWGCRFNVPDWVLLLIGLIAVRRGETVIFGKHPPPRILWLLRMAAANRSAFVFVTPYRPEPPAAMNARHAELRRHNLYDAIIVQSELFATDLRNLGYAGPISVIPYMPEQVTLLQTFPKNGIRIGFLGRLVEDKRVDLLLAAFASLLNGDGRSAGEHEAGLTLHLYGDGHLRSELESVTNALGTKPHVTFHGIIPQREVRNAIESCHFFVFTSRVEGQCLAALEILSCGRPVVATRAGAFEDILADERLGILATTDSPEEIAKCLSAMIDRINHQRATPEAVQSAYLNRYGADEIGERYLEVLNLQESSV